MIKKYWFIAIIIMAIIIIRFWNFPNWFGFDYDQEVNAWLAKTIVVDLKPILIGPQTSVGGMFAGPAFNYVVAIFYFLGRMNPVATIGLNILISGLTMVALYLIVTKIFSRRAGIVATLIYGLSYNLTNFDRVSWNPLPIHLVSLCIVFFLYRFVQTRAIRYLALSSIFVGIFLQLHFTAIFLIAYLFLVLIIYCHQFITKKPLFLILPIGIILIFLFPLFLFDIRHDFLISFNFINFITTGNHTNGAGVAFRFVTIARIIVDFFKAIIYNESSRLATFLSGVGLALALTITFFREKADRKLFLKLCWTLVYVPAILLPFYSGPLPSQYLQFLMPVCVIFLTILADTVMNLKIGKVLIVQIFVLFLAYNVPKILSSNNGLSLLNKMNAVKYIIKDSGPSTFKVDFVTLPGLKTGFRYLFWLSGRELVEDMHVKTDRNYKIIIPFYLVKSSDLAITFGGIGVIKL